VTVPGHGIERRRAPAAALLGWAALAIQLGLSLNYSLVAGDGPVHGFIMFIGYFTITTNIFAALIFTAHATGSAASVWAFFRRPGVITCAAGSMLIVGSIYFFVLRHLWHPEGLQFIADVLLHYVMPPLTLVFWWLVVPRGAVDWSGVAKMLIYPFAYLFYVFIRGPIVGSYPYPFIDVTALGLGRALLNSAGIAILFIVVIAAMMLLNNRGTPRTATD